MSRFLNRIIAPGLRRVGPAGRFDSPRKGEPVLEEIAAQIIERPPVEESPVSPAASPSFPDQERREAPPREARSREEVPTRSSFSGPEEAPLNGPTAEPEAASLLPFAGEAAPLFEERSLSASDSPAAPRSDRSGAPPIAEERTKGDGEMISFEEMAFDPAVHLSIRRFQPSGEKPRADKLSDRAKSEAGPDRSSAREIVWEVVPTDRTIPHRKESVRQEAPRPQGERSGPPISDRMQPSSPSDRPSQTAKKEEQRLGPLTQSQSAPIRPREAALPRPAARPIEEKGDLIIEQLEVRVVAEPERRPEPPKERPAAPKRSGAWETAARYYLGKV